MIRGYYPNYAQRMWKKEWGVSIEISEEDKRDLLKGKAKISLPILIICLIVLTTHENGR